MKVLIVSHNPLSPQGNMGKTLVSLFSGFQKEELCQLYIYPAVPSQVCCGSYYRVTDKEALASLVTGQPIGGEISLTRVGQHQGSFENPEDMKLYRSPKNKSALRRFGRDGIWKLARWYDRSLKAWLEAQRPDVIFAAPGASLFLYDMALQIANDRKLPLVTYLCDEYYFVTEPKGGLDRLRLLSVKRKMEEILARSAHLAVISREMQVPYAQHFGLPVSVVMTGAGIIPAAAPKTAEKPKIISYFGGIRANRYHSLETVARVLAEISAETGESYRLRIYTAEQDAAILGTLTRWETVDLMPFASGEDYESALKRSQILLHTEAFDPASRQRVQGSISTKLADYLASGVPLVAFGPEEIASMAHLERSRCALCITAPEQLKEGLLTVLRDGALRAELSQRALETAKIHHDPHDTGRAIRAILEDAKQKNLKILQVNSLIDHQSTGKITRLVHQTLRRRGFQILTVYGRGPRAKQPGTVRLCPRWYGKWQGLRVRLGGLPYGGCEYATRRLERIIRRERPDVVHLQCINGHFVNIYRLIDWLKQEKIPTAVALHAEFMYTAGCGHAFDCEQWKTGCGKCPHGGRRSWEKMRAAFSGMEDSCILLPVSDWVADRARQGDILGKLPAHTLYNAVDPRIFYAQEKSREENTVLYVTAHFDTHPAHLKGGRYLVELAKRLPEITFFVAGPGKPGKLPENVKFLGPISDQTRLAALYGRAKLTLITSRRETFSMPCAESLCCGTPVVGFRAGGPESAMPPEGCEFVPFGDLDALEQAVRNWLQKPVSAARIASDALHRFGPEQIVEELVNIYEQLC